MLHFGTLNYVSSYFLGILLGYLIANKITLLTTPLQVKAAQAIFPSLIVLSMFIPAIAGDDHLPRFQQLLVAPLARTLLSFAVAGEAYLCWLGHGGILNKFLSAPIFGRLARFSFSTFMVHYLLLWYEASVETRHLDFRPFAMGMRILSSTVVAQVLGYLVFLVFEAPAFNVAKALLSKSKDKVKEKAL